jgi:hypothetical protein
MAAMRLPDGEKDIALLLVFFWEKSLHPSIKIGEKLYLAVSCSHA